MKDHKNSGRNQKEVNPTVQYLVDHGLQKFCNFIVVMATVFGMLLFLSYPFIMAILDDSSKEKMLRLEEKVRILEKENFSLKVIINKKGR